MSMCMRMKINPAETRVCDFVLASIDRDDLISFCKATITLGNTALNNTIDEDREVAAICALRSHGGAGNMWRGCREKCSYGTGGCTDMHAYIHIYESI